MMPSKRKKKTTREEKNVEKRGGTHELKTPSARGILPKASFPYKRAKRRKEEASKKKKIPLGKCDRLLRSLPTLHSEKIPGRKRFKEFANETPTIAPLKHDKDR